MKQYSFLIESIQQSVSNNISNNLVYHGSNKKLDVIKGSYTNKWTNEVGNVFVTPFKGLCSCFVIDRNIVLDKLCEQFNCRNFKGLNFGYDVWAQCEKYKDKLPNHVTIEMNLKNIKPFSGTSTGYLYTIDFNRYKDKCHMFNKNPNSDVEFLIEGDVDFIKREKFNVKWTVTSSDICIKHHGLAQPIDCKEIKIDFPRDEIPNLKNKKSFSTTRVSEDYNKYSVGNIVLTPWNRQYKIVKRVDIQNVKQHPYYKELTKQQIDFLKKYNKLCVLWLELI